MAIREVLLGSRAKYHELLAAAAATAVQVGGRDACATQVGRSACGRMPPCRAVQSLRVHALAAAPASRCRTTPPCAAHPPSAPQAAVAGDSMQVPVEVASEARARDLFGSLALPATFQPEVRRTACLSMC